TPNICPPKHFEGLPHKAYLNTPMNEGREGRGEGRERRKFVDVSKEAGLLPAGPDSSKGLGVLFIDVNGDGKPDVYVPNDAVDKYLYLNHSVPGKIRFEEVGLRSGAARDGKGQPN